MEYNTDHFLSMLAKMNISLSDKQLQQFMTYYEMLIEKNKVMNLTAIRVSVCSGQLTALFRDSAREKQDYESDCHYRF